MGSLRVKSESKRNCRILIAVVIIAIIIAFYTIKPRLSHEFQDPSRWIIQANRSYCQLYQMRKTPNHNFLSRKYQERSCSSEPYVTVVADGGFGNVLCEYITTLFLQLEFGVPIAINESMHERISEHFRFVSAPTVSQCADAEEAEANIFLTYDLLEERKARRAKVLNETLILHGNPCPLQYLIQRRKYLRTQFPWRKEVFDQARELLEGVKSRVPHSSGKTLLVSVHVRREDYLEYAVDRGRILAPLSFYRNSFRYFRTRFKSVIFVVFSDDISWCMENLSFPDVYFPHGKETVLENSTYIIDFAAMTLCDHHIIGDGTFGFTSALLGRGLVAYHPKTFVDTVSESNNVFSCHYGSEEYVPITSVDL